jgi:hypothetical protein
MPPAQLVDEEIEDEELAQLDDDEELQPPLLTTTPPELLTTPQDAEDLSILMSKSGILFPPPNIGKLFEEQLFPKEANDGMILFVDPPQPFVEEDVVIVELLLKLLLLLLLLELTTNCFRFDDPRPRFCPNNWDEVTVEGQGGEDDGGGGGGGAKGG